MLKINLKSVSILISSVLLVVFLLSVSFLVYLWMVEYAKDITKKAEDQRRISERYHNYDLITCAKANILLENVSFYSTSKRVIIEDFDNTDKIDYEENITVDIANSVIYLSNESNGTSYYRYEINISNENSVDLTDYQVKIIYDTAYYISLGMMRSDCKDIRFKDANNNSLNYWVWSHTCNTNATEIYVLLPLLPANSNTTIYLEFGDNKDYGYGNYSSVFVNSYASHNNRLVVLSSSPTNTCALLPNGSVMCWGDNANGQLGDGTTKDKPYPVFVRNPDNTSILSDIVGIDVFSSHTCALLSNGSVLCWGDNFNGQIGIGYSSSESVLLPTFVKDTQNSSILNNIKEIKLGLKHTCALLTNGSVLCWGYNYYGQLGDGTTKDKPYPVFVRNPDNTSILSDILHISVGNYHTCALLTNGSVLCWGYNGGGQLGIGSSGWSPNPLPLFVKDSTGNSILSGVVKIESGFLYTCALLSNGSVMCWGDNANGQLGDGTINPSFLPVIVRDPTNTTALGGAVELDVTGYTTCALLSNGSGLCWGYNVEGWVGDGTTNDKNLPTFVKDSANSSILKNVVDIEVGCALLSNGSVLCWGDNSEGRVGDGTRGVYDCDGNGFDDCNPLPTLTLNYSLSSLYNKTAGIYTTLNYSTDVWFLVKLRHNISEVKQYNISLLTLPVLRYIPTSLLQTLDILSFNSTPVSALEKIVFHITTLSSLVEVFISQNNSSYEKINLDTSNEYRFSSDERQWKSLYIRLVLNSTPWGDASPIVDGYEVFYSSYVSENATMLVFNPTKLNLTLNKIIIKYKERDYYCDYDPVPYYIEGNSLERYIVPNCTISCKEDDVEVIISTECGVYRFGTVC